MSIQFQSTPQQDQAFAKMLKDLDGVPGPLMKALQKAQEIYGFLPMEIQEQIANHFGVPLAEIYGIATFYSQFNLFPKGKNKVGICMGTACYVRGSGDILSKFKQRLKIEPGQTTEDGKFTLDATRCIGCCGLAPVLTVNDEVYGKVAEGDVDKILAKYND